LIRHTHSKEFFKQGEWISNPLLAQEIEGFAEALDLKQRYHLEDVELYYLAHEAPNAHRDWSVNLR
jgi:hypothetical protein